MTNWNKLCDNFATEIQDFAKGELSGRELTGKVAGTSQSPAVRNLLRKRGVLYARRLARKALKRRGVSC